MVSTFDKSYFGSQLKMLRKVNKLTQAQLGEKIGVGQTTVSNWEKGIREPENIGEVVKLAEMFKVDLSFLIKDTEEQARKQEEELKELSETADWSGYIEDFEKRQKLLKEVTYLESDNVDKVLEYIEFIKNK